MREEVSEGESVYNKLDLFGVVFERIRAQYVEDVESTELIEDAINGMLVALDPHSSYLDEDDFNDMRIDTKGEFGGLGIEVTMEDGLVKVVSPIDDTPAYNAGIQAKDYITHLDGESIIGLPLSDAVDRMRGKVGTDIEITVRREGVSEPLIIVITRAVIKVQSVKYNA
jgi:carboxyl-terminal processing protease